MTCDHDNNPKRQSDETKMSMSFPYFSPIFSITITINNATNPLRSKGEKRRRVRSTQDFFPSLDKAKAEINYSINLHRTKIARIQRLSMWPGLYYTYVHEYSLSITRIPDGNKISYIYIYLYMGEVIFQLINVKGKSTALGLHREPT